jgi:hypothetical protein
VFLVELQLICADFQLICVDLQLFCADLLQCYNVFSSAQISCISAANQRQQFTANQRKSIAFQLQISANHCNPVQISANQAKLMQISARQLEIQLQISAKYCKSAANK